MTKSKKNRAVVVTTEFRGVFFGYVVSDDNCPDEITLQDARLCIYWSTKVNGFTGLASTGPTKECKIGPPVDLKLYKITSVLKCTGAAEKAWISG